MTTYPTPPLPMSSLKYFFICRLLPALLAMSMLGCTPLYDWREVHAGGARVLLPGKAQSMTRVVDLDGVRADMTMHAARVDGVSFALGWTDLVPTAGDREPRDLRRERMLAAMRSALTRNFGAPNVLGKPVMVARAERMATGVVGEEIQASGQANGQPVLVQARFVGVETRVWQFVAYGPPTELETPVGRQAVETFLLSVRLD